MRIVFFYRRSGYPLDMNVMTAAEMRETDRRAIEEYSIPGIALMESAGGALAHGCIEELGGNATNRRITLICGKGNNGGDGFVAARHLRVAGAEVHIVIVGATPDLLQGDAKTYFKPLITMGVPTMSLQDTGELPSLAALLDTSDLAVDCLVGTGFRPPLEGLAARVADIWNFHARRRVACDIPSGIHADQGDNGDGPVFSADRTITFAALKRGLLQFPGATYAGRITVAPIGIPSELLDRAASAVLTTRDWIYQTVPQRKQSRDANKGRFGTVLVIAGSAGMAGAATLTALSALRAGAGLVQLALPESVLDTAATLAPELVLKALPETPERTHGGDGALEAALALAEKADAVAIGPGIGGGNTVTIRFVQTFVHQIGSNKPLVIDADGLNAISIGGPETLAGRDGSHTVLTPHPGEMSRLLGREARMIQTDRTTTVIEGAKRYNATILLKGARTLLATAGDDRIYFNRSGSVSLATAGSGDVLTGVIAALLADRENGLTALDAARAGAYLHAIAGEICEKKHGSVGTVATEVRDALPSARALLYDTANDFWNNDEY